MFYKFGMRCEILRRAMCAQSCEDIFQQRPKQRPPETDVALTVNKGFA